MNERILTIEQADPAIFNGVNSCNIQLIKALYPKLKKNIRLSTAMTKAFSI